MRHATFRELDVDDALSLWACAKKSLLTCTAFLIEVEQSVQNFTVAEIARPSICVGNGIVERAVGVIEPSRALIVEISQLAFFELLALFFGQVFTR